MIEVLAGLLNGFEDFAVDPFDLMMVGAAVLAAVPSSLILMLGLWRPVS